MTPTNPFSPEITALLTLLQSLPPGTLFTARACRLHWPNLPADERTLRTRLEILASAGHLRRVFVWEDTYYSLS